MLDRLLAAPALRSADAVLIDAGLPSGTIAYIRGVARYVELVPASSEGRDRSRRRALTLAREGWRVVRVFRREPVGTADAVLTAASLAEAGIRLRIDGVVGAHLDDFGTKAGWLAITLPAATESLAGVAG
jgi:siroheme synthase